MIRVYGFEDSPLFFPKIVPNRIAYMEIIRKMGESNSMHLASHDKQSFMPGTLYIGEFVVNGREGKVLACNKLFHYNMKLGAPRKGFDPKGYIHSMRKRQKLGAYEHTPYLRDDDKKSR